MTSQNIFTTSVGYPLPYGTSPRDDGINFALFSRYATSVTLLLYSQDDAVVEFKLDPEKNRTGNVWHLLVHKVPPHLLYGYKISNSDKILLDPYAKEVGTTNQWADCYDVIEPHDDGYLPLGRVSTNSEFNWDNTAHPNIPMKDLILYEMHVRGLTQDPSSRAKYPGTFLGVVEKIPHLLELGVNAVELMPIQEFNEHEYEVCSLITKQRLYNYWGYSTVNFFAPMNRYASKNTPGAALTEFKTMVRELHRNGIEVILDVVFNHTSEGNEEGPINSFKGIANSTYYILAPDGTYLNYSGCGNTVNCNSPIVREWILDCLRYWVLEMHVDGFRFDLASILTRDTDGTPLDNPPLIEAITQDPILAHTKLIAEPWDAAGLYQVGSFYARNERWAEWNAIYRDHIRRFIKGVPGLNGSFATRLCGSEDLYYNRSPAKSINFVTCHDGFTLADMVSYNSKHNLPNGEANRDGNNNNESWNCGVEGPTFNDKIIAIRQRQMRNFHMALMLSLGVPMILMGDEYAHTKKGNNNTWCHDSDLNWFQWDQLETNRDFFRFYKLLIHFRKQCPSLNQESFLTDADIKWHGAIPYEPDWKHNSQFIAFTLVKEGVYAAFNASDKPITVEFPPGDWRWVVNTAAAPPHDFYEERPVVIEQMYTMLGYSSILLILKDKQQ